MKITLKKNVFTSCIPTKKSSLGYLSLEEVTSLTFLYCKSYPEFGPSLNNGSLKIPLLYQHKFSHAFINGKKVSPKSENAKQPYVAATFKTVCRLQVEQQKYYQ